MSHHPRTPWTARTVALVALDTVIYAVSVGLVALAGAVVLGVATGGGLVRAKVLLFLLGFVLMGYATLQLWPSTPDELASDLERHRQVTRERRQDPSSTDGPPFERFVDGLPFVRSILPPADRRLRPASKLFVGSLAVLGISMVMEFGLGIQ